MAKLSKKNKNAVLIILAILIMAGGMAIRVLPIAALGAVFLLGILINNLISKM
ncbi:hypothetical protein [Salinivirga cyanobacteriivorans]|uniref:Uncharacterized protein n=1 Tax=Salinivirga cyanobacteriivorans TaxID=1307839 RepID=A0A0S2I3R2_9BACT|nr:hypothetical protein [Salinivirga cyanobacteriivorans]ALO16882.1 hypothetical protein L21SP5_03268 [Salinivirga cyanobacteriivorans]